MAKLIPKDKTPRFAPAISTTDYSEIPHSEMRKDIHSTDI